MIKKEFLANLGTIFHKVFLSNHENTKKMVPKSTIIKRLVTKESKSVL